MNGTEQKHYVYFIKAETDGEDSYKIGYTSIHPESRLPNLQTGNPNLLILIGWVEKSTAEKARKLEKTLHKKLRAYQQRGEWFKLPERVILDIIAEGGMIPNPPVEGEFNTIHFEIYREHYVWVEKDQLTSGYFAVIDNTRSENITTMVGCNEIDAIGSARESIDRIMESVNPNH